jgi:hypothetical protein
VVDRDLYGIPAPLAEADLSHDAVIILRVLQGRRTAAADRSSVAVADSRCRKRHLEITGTTASERATPG